MEKGKYFFRNNALCLFLGMLFIVISVVHSENCTYVNVWIFPSMHLLFLLKIDYSDCSVSLSSSYGSTRMGSSPFGTSPGGFMSGSSPPVGSTPKSFPHFQHPSHALLEDNGFKQQK